MQSQFLMPGEWVSLTNVRTKFGPDGYLEAVIHGDDSKKRRITLLNGTESIVQPAKK